MMSPLFFKDDGKLLRFICLFLLAFFQSYVIAAPVDLLHCFADAIDNDPIYQADVAIYNQKKQAIPESYAALLPQVTLSSGVSNEFEYQGQLASGNFLVSNYGLQANQTVFNYTQFRQLEQARYSVRSAFATLTAQQQDLMIRTAKAYLDVLQTHDLLVFTKDQKKYIVEQLNATKTLFDHNDATITDLEQAKGAADLIDAELYAAEINYYNAIQALSQITGIVYEEFRYLNPAFPLIHPKPEKLSIWTDIANKQNWNLRASRLDVLAAREALAAAKGNFLPTVTANGSMTNSVVPNLILTNPVRNMTNIIGMNANWNIFQGGLTIAQVATAAANLQQMEAALRQQYLQTMAATHISYNSIEVGVARVKSIRASLVDNTAALLHAQEAYRAGELTITEILQIQYQLYRAQQRYAEYIYSYIMDTLLLKQAAGILDVRSLSVVNCWLQHPKHHQAAKKI